MILDAPSSKSMTQRALVIAGLSRGTTRIERPLVCDDSRYLTDLFRALGAEVSWSEGLATVHARGLTTPSGAVFCGNAGTAVRFGACLSLLLQGALTLDGDAHMRKRPIGELGEALGTMGVAVRYIERAGCPPLELRRTSEPPATASVDTSISSQFASGLLMVAPCLPRGLALALTGGAVSMPYIHMTVAMMQRAGADIRWEGDRSIVVGASGYGGAEIIGIEPDWSGAAFILAAAGLTGKDLRVAGLLPAGESLQGDAAFEKMAADLARGADALDLSDVPDLIAPLAALCLFSPRAVRIRGAAHTRVKESDRVAVLCRELAKLGANVTAHPDGMDIAPLAAIPQGSIALDPEDDHRMAMAFGILGLRIPGIEVHNPTCVSKSFPHFWDVLDRIRGG